MNASLLHGIREMAEDRRLTLEEHLKTHQGNQEEEWASSELIALNKLHSAITSYLAEIGQD